MEEIILPNLPNTKDILNPPEINFYVPVAEVPYLDPLLLPSLEQIDSGLGEDQAVDSSQEEATTSEGININPEQIPTNLPKNLENISIEEPVATFTVPFLGEMPIPPPEVIVTSVLTSGVSATAAVAGSIVLQSVITQLKKIFTKIFKKVLKKEVANLQKKDQSSDEHKT